MPKFLQWALITTVAVVAYIIGTRAGESRYREIRRAARKVWNDPGVKKVRDRTYRKVEKAARRAAKRIG